MREECIANCSGDSVKNKHHWVLSLDDGWQYLWQYRAQRGQSPGGAGGHWPGHEGYAALWHIVISAAACHCHYSPISCHSLIIMLSCVCPIHSCEHHEHRETWSYGLHCLHYMNMRTRNWSWLLRDRYFLFAVENKMRFLRQFSPRQGWSQTTLDIPTYSHVRINL